MTMDSDQTTVRLAEEAASMGLEPVLVDEAYVAGCHILVYDMKSPEAKVNGQISTQRRIAAYKPNGQQMFSAIVASGWEDA